MIEIRVTAFDDPVAVRMCTAQQAEVMALYGFDSEPGPKPTAADVTHFVVAWLDGAPAGCGGLRPLPSPGTVELKRFYTEPAFRGRGVATAIIGALEDAARAAGFAVARVETGHLLPVAIALYQRAGYHAIDPFDHYAGSELSRCFERAL